MMFPPQLTGIEGTETEIHAPPVTVTEAKPWKIRVVSW
jgi:hypothetical protein